MVPTDLCVDQRCPEPRSDGSYCTGKMAKQKSVRENTGNVEIFAKTSEFCLLKLKVLVNSLILRYRIFVTFAVKFSKPVLHMKNLQY